jgi:hypothetical protein
MKFLKDTFASSETNQFLIYPLREKTMLYSPPNTHFVRGYHSEGKFIPSDEDFEFKLIDN